MLKLGREVVGCRTGGANVGARIGAGVGGTQRCTTGAGVGITAGRHTGGAGLGDCTMGAAGLRGGKITGFGFDKSTAQWVPAWN